MQKYLNNLTLQLSKKNFGVKFKEIFFTDFSCKKIWFLFHICFMLTTLCYSIFSWIYMIVSQLKINNSQKLNTTDMGFIHLSTHNQGFTDQFKITDMPPLPL